MSTLTCYRCRAWPCRCADGISIVHGDCREVMAAMEPDTFDAVVCDPPYELGFMGKSWDATGVSFDPATWAAVLRVCKPGAFMLAFSGTRTYHRMVCAIEDAGWRVHPMLAWVFGTGFPKAANLSKMIDKVAGVEREVVGQGAYAARRPHPVAETNIKGAEYGFGAGHTLSAPATDAARGWDGWAYGLQCLKPAVEPICMAQKPYDGKAVESIQKHGCGALAIDRSRIAADDHPGIHKSMSNTLHEGYRRPWRDGGPPQYKSTPAGRWPSNVILQHVEDQPCPACEGDYPACKLCGGTGVIRGCVCQGVKRVKSPTGGQGGNDPGMWAGKKQVDITRYADADGLETVEDWQCVDGCPVGMLPESKDGVASPEGGVTGMFAVGNRDYSTGYGGGGSNARFFYTSKSSRAEREENLLGRLPCVRCGGLNTITHTNEQGQSVPCIRNAHPTVKPLDLMSYLAKLLSLPGYKGKLLDPFAGTASTLLAASKWWENCVGIEQDEAWCKVAAARLAQNVLFK